jgi:hypothetical protein
MTECDAQDPGYVEETPLSRRDWILLPVISLLTIGILATSVELIARITFSESKKSIASCLTFNDRSTGTRGIPNCYFREKSPETGWVDGKFNSCGYLAGMECGTKKPGTYRIVMTGSSIALGEHVQREKTFAALLPEELTRRTGRKIELYNEGMGFGFTHATSLRFKDVLSAQPDLILWILTPTDVENAFIDLPQADSSERNSKSFRDKILLRIKENFGSRSFSSAAAEVFGRTRTALVLRHYLYQSQSQYVKASLANADTNEGFLKAQPSPLWQGRLQQVNSDAGSIEGRAKAAGVPLVAVLIPTRVQAAMLSMGEWPAGYDPYKLDEELRTIIVSHGGTFVDILPSFRVISNPERNYLPVDGHPNENGHAMLSQMLATTLTDGAVAGLKAGSQPATPVEQTR